MNFGAFTHDFDEFDAEAHPYGRYALISYLNQKRINNFKNQMLELRAEADHEKKLAAFDQLSSNL